MEKINTIHYACVTAVGKRLYIVAETKSVNNKGTTIASYRLSDDLNEAAKCVNKTTAKTLIKDYTDSTNSTRTFLLQPVMTTYEILEDVRDE